MSIETWLAYTAACIILTIIPGPSVLLVVGQALTRGKTAALVCIVGDVVGGGILVVLSFAGVGAILSASAALFQAVKWAGVFYLAWLGYCQIAEAGQRFEEGAKMPTESSAWGSFWAGTITAILNPKAIVFYVAFLSQFINPNGSLPVQLTVLVLTSSAVILVFLTAYALLASRIGSRLKSQRARRRVGYVGGGFMIGGSIFMAATR